MAFRPRANMSNISFAMGTFSYLRQSRHFPNIPRIKVLLFGLFRNEVKSHAIYYFYRYKWLKLANFVNVIILLKGTISGISCIFTHIFVNINYMKR